MGQIAAHMPQPQGMPLRPLYYQAHPLAPHAAMLPATMDPRGPVAAYPAHYVAGVYLSESTTAAAIQQTQRDAFQMAAA